MSGGGLNNMISQLGQPPSSSGGSTAPNNPMAQAGSWLSNTAANLPAQQPKQQPVGFDNGQAAGMAEDAAYRSMAPSAYQPTGPNTGWGRSQFSVNPNTESLAQATWLRGPDGVRATADVNARNLAAFNANQKPVDRNTFSTTRTVSNGEGGDYTENYFDQAGYDKAVAAQKANTYKPLTNQEAFDQTLRDSIKSGMGNYDKLVQGANEYGASMADVQRAIGPGNDVYTYMNRPNYQQYSPNGQFNQPIYQSNYQNYNTGNAMGVSQYGSDANIYAPQMQNPFNPYTNSYAQQTPFSYQQNAPAGGNTLTPALARSLMQRSMSGGVPTSEFNQYGGYDAVQSMYNNNGGTYSPPAQQTPFSYQQPAVPTYGTAAQTLQTAMTPRPAIVGRSSSLRGTPNVMARKAEGGIASLMDDVE